MSERVLSALLLVALSCSTRRAVLAGGVPVDDRESRQGSEAHMQMELSIDSLERRCVRPHFIFLFPLGPMRILAEIDYLQRMSGSLQGAIDYWLILGLQKEWPGRALAELRINHLCRHLTSIYQPSIFNTNEVIGRLWLEEENFRLGLGAGIFTGGNADYRNLCVVNLEVPRLFLDELGFRSELKWVDVRQLFHEVELYFRLDRSTEFFIRHTKTYEYPAAASLGLRVQSTDGAEKYIECFQVLTGMFPVYERYKMAAQGRFTLNFFSTDSRRVVATAFFRGPILTGRGFFDSFWPDQMNYDLWMQYEKKLKPDLFISAYGKYSLNMPCDKALPFDADLGVGLALRNQPDFERTSRPVRYELMAGLNFKHGFDLIVKLGFNTRPRDRGPVLGVLAQVRANGKETFAEGRLFASWGGRVEVRPFVGLDRITISATEKFSWSRVMFGVDLLKWFR